MLQKEKKMYLVLTQKEFSTTYDTACLYHRLILRSLFLPYIFWHQSPAIFVLFEQFMYQNIQHLRYITALTFGISVIYTILAILLFLQHCFCWKSKKPSSTLFKMFINLYYTLHIFFWFSLFNFLLLISAFVYYFSKKIDSFLLFFC